MVISQIDATSIRIFRASDHRFTSLPVKDVFKIRMRDLDLKNTDMQKALEYPNANVISMIKNGSMRIPAGKAVIAAKMLEVDPVFLLAKVISENDLELWDAISEVMADQLVTANEMALLTMVRRELDGHDVNLAESPAYVAATIPALKEIRERQSALARAAIDRADE